MSNHTKTWVDIGVAIIPFLGVLSTILGILASMLSIAWFSIRIYEYFKSKSIIEE